MKNLKLFILYIVITGSSLLWANGIFAPRDKIYNCRIGLEYWNGRQIDTIITILSITVPELKIIEQKPLMGKSCNLLYYKYKSRCYGCTFGFTERYEGYFWIREVKKYEIFGIDISK